MLICFKIKKETNQKRLVSPLKKTLDLLFDKLYHC